MKLRSKSIRRAIAQGRAVWRDRQLSIKKNKKCPICRARYGTTGHRPTVDHIIPLSKGGSDTPDNWQLMCESCNFDKGNKLPAN